MSTSAVSLPFSSDDANFKKVKIEPSSPRSPIFIDLTDEFDADVAGSITDSTDPVASSASMIVDGTAPPNENFSQLSTSSSERGPNDDEQGHFLSENSYESSLNTFEVFAAAAAAAAAAVDSQQHSDLHSSSFRSSFATKSSLLSVSPLNSKSPPRVSELNTSGVANLTIQSPQTFQQSSNPIWPSSYSPSTTISHVSSPIHRPKHHRPSSGGTITKVSFRVL